LVRSEARNRGTRLSRDSPRQINKCVSVYVAPIIIAIRALAHKLARASYYVMKDQVDFDSERVFG